MSGAEHDLQQLRERLEALQRQAPMTSSYAWEELAKPLIDETCAALLRVGERIDAQQPEISELEILVAKSAETADVRADAEAGRAEQIDRIPSHRSDELPRYIQINRLNFRVDAETLTGAQLRYLPTPPISTDYDLFKIGVGRDDVIVRDDDVIDLRGARFFTSPKIINAGSDSARIERPLLDRASGPVSGAGGNT